MAIFEVVKVIFWGCLLLSILVGIHEGGHYLLARASGMRVTEFFLGMPCKYNLSFRSKSRGTKFGVTPILLGGYTRICGMEGTPSEHCADVLAYIASNGYVSIEKIEAELDFPKEEIESDLAVLVDWGSITQGVGTKVGKAFGDSIGDEVAIYCTVKRDPELRCWYDKGHDFAMEGTTEACEPHALIPASAASKDTSAIVNRHDVAQAFFESERSRTYLGKGFWPRLAALVAGPAVNIILGLLSVALVLSISGVTVSVDKSGVSSVVPGSYAEEIGLEAGDSITSVNGVATVTWEDFSDAFDSAIASTDSFVIEVQRGENNSDTLEFTLDSSEITSRGALGIYAPTELYHPSIVASLGASWNYVVMVAKSIFLLFIPTQTAEVLSQSSSVVGISVMASEAAESGLSDFIYLMAAVSLSLGFMNLLPIPPLDGGKILLEFIGAIRRKPVSEKVQLNLSYIGLALFLGLFVFAVHQDILRFVLGG